MVEGLEAGGTSFAGSTILSRPLGLVLEVACITVIRGHTLARLDFALGYLTNCLISETSLVIL